MRRLPLPTKAGVRARYLLGKVSHEALAEAAEGSGGPRVNSHGIQNCEMVGRNPRGIDTSR